MPRDRLIDIWPEVGIRWWEKIWSVDGKWKRKRAYEIMMGEYEAL